MCTLLRQICCRPTTMHDLSLEDKRNKARSSSILDPVTLNL